MQGEELPNGFTGFTKRKAGFESAGEAMRKSAAAAEARKGDTSRFRDASRGAQHTWAHEQKPVESNLMCSQASWNPGDIKRYLRLPDIDAGESQPTYDKAAMADIPEEERRWAWVEVDLSAIRHNVLAVRDLLPINTLLMAVVKADAYGHGAVQCAKAAINSGADYLGVATIDEAIELRDAEIGAPILLLAEPPMEAIPLLLAYNVEPTVYTVEFAIRYAEAADTISARAPYHLKINTGMNRIGVRFNEVVDFLRHVSFHRALDLVGTFTHFATADETDTLEFDRQVARFEEALGAMRSAGIDPGIVHACNSAAIIRFPHVHYDMVRLGLSLYGFYPCQECFGLVDLVPAMSVHARITDVKTVPLGEGVSYGLNYRSGGLDTICTLPIGYGDGLRRGLSGKTKIVLNGIAYPQVGNICMDQCMIEASSRSRRARGALEPQIGDEVLVVGSQGDAFVTIDEMAFTLGTIQHEIAIGFGNTRLPRIYK